MCIRDSTGSVCWATMCVSSRSDLLLMLLVLLIGADAQMGLGGAKKPKPKVIKADLAFIQCDVCEALADSLHQQVSKLPPAPPPQGRVGSRSKAQKSRLSEADVAEILEEACAPKSKAGQWVASHDIVTRDGRTVLDRQGGPGHCKRECQTIARSCEELVESVDPDDLQVALWREVDLPTLRESLCREWSGVCPQKKRAVVRKVDEKFKPKTEKEIELDEMMAKMEAMGMGGTMMSTDDLTPDGEAPDDDDEDL
eukprot:TRINITY_DN13887_c0_g1_i3.p1 TRINITY_DN13887_c0_g1~~TRINITY_DN13887_c0_g1_i3.p1  ORF type:complete len:254 (-),score=61.72 TRINITY_DN13887_c0_g1_i3:256-1017(-)